MEDKLLYTQLYGIWNKEIHADVPPLNNVIVIAMYPIAAEYLLRNSISNFFNTYQSITKFHELIQTDTRYSFQNIIDVFSNHFDEKLKKIDSRKIELFQLIRQTKGQTTIEETENKIFWTQRQMNRYFSECLGVSLKAYLNIIRCSHTYNQVNQGELNPSSDFTDQSHFIKELKKHTGSTPKQLFTKFNEENLDSSVL
jgi:AraC-like DNA-binding protein